MTDSAKNSYWQQQIAGIFWAAVSVFCWGTLFPAVTMLNHRGNIDSFSMAQCRFLWAGLLMLAFLFLRRKTLPQNRMSGKDWLNIIFNSIFAGAMSVALFYGQSLGIPTVNASMLEAEAPLLIFLGGIIILKNGCSWLQTTGILLGFAGSILVLKVVSSSGVMINSLERGDLMVLAGAIFWAIYTIAANGTIKRIGGLRYTAWSMFFAGLWILIFQLAMQMPCCYPKNGPDFWNVLYLSVIPTALAFFSWNNAQRYISTGLLAISGYFTPILTALLSWFMFRENITWMQILGMILVLGSSLIEPEIAGLCRFKKINSSAKI